MNNKFKLTGALLASALLAGLAQAEIALSPNLSVDGYAAGSAQYSRDKYDGGGHDDDATMDLNAVRLNANFKYDAVTAKISLYHDSDDLYVPEAYVAYKFGNGFELTAGRFLTWAGYEAFDIPALSALTYADEWTNIIPAHHDGVKVTYNFDNFTVGAAVLDSLYGNFGPEGFNPYRGDGNINHGSLGAELYFAYNDQTFSASVTIGYQHDHAWEGFDTYYVNVWGQYYIDSSKTTLGVELNYHDADFWAFSLDGTNLLPKTQTFTGQIFAKQAITEKWAISGRISGGQLDSDYISDKVTFVKGTIAPSLTLTENLEIRGEVSYTTFDKAPVDSSVFVGVQAVFKF
ncbi:MAG: porin [Opitutaceae bacterium]|jgi:hypothetical protein|nr:porin [Opitutaceae bacterium]